MPSQNVSWIYSNNLSTITHGFRSPFHLTASQFDDIWFKHSHFSHFFKCTTLLLTELWVVRMLKQRDKETVIELKRAWELLVNLSKQQKHRSGLSNYSPIILMNDWRINISILGCSESTNLPNTVKEEKKNCSLSLVSNWRHTHFHTALSKWMATTQPLSINQPLKPGIHNQQKSLLALVSRK